ncbi:hypothetical protein BH20ACT1_BH20ACT1_02310 [soil metagenome]
MRAGSARPAGRVVALVSALTILSALATACVGGDPFEPLAVPPPNPDLSTTTTAPPDYRGVALAPVEGTTTTTEVGMGPGPAALVGRVDGPDGPVAGATVRLERLVGDASGVLDVTTGDDGTWRAADVLGGRYRVRAWLAPELAAVEPQILFVAGNDTGNVDFVVDRFRPTVVDLAVAPDPPVVGAPTNVVVRVASQVVDNDGVVRVSPRPGQAVALGAGGSWNLQGTDVATTGSAGTATFTLVCRSPGPQSLMVTLAAGEVFPLAPPDCVAPASPSSTPPPTAETSPETSPGASLPEPTE